jgi:RNA polymerase sigma-70 factor, ECF subfamily
MVVERANACIERLVADHHAAVYRYAYRLTGSVHDAEDLTQQVFLVAQGRLEQLRDPANARGWLIAILRNRFLKEAQRPEAVPATTVGVDLDGFPAEIPSGEEIDRERLQEALSELPAEFRVVLLMFYFEDRSYREIAGELQLPIGTVMSRLARAKNHLRTRLFRQEPSSDGRPRPMASR